MYIDRAIEFHGVDNFVNEIICNCRNLTHANEMEKFFIAFYDTFEGDGYNLTEGGSNAKKSLSVKKKMSKAKQGWKPASSKRLFLGVSTRKGSKSFTTTVSVGLSNSKSKNFPTQIEAAEAYDKVVLFIFGNDAVLNFPEKLDDYLSLDLELFYNLFIFNNSPRYSNFVGVTKKKDKFGNLKWTVLFQGRLRKILYAQIRETGGDFIPLEFFDTEIDAAIFSDKFIFYFDLPCRFNFPEIIVNLSKTELASIFAERIKTRYCAYTGVSFSRGKWIKFYTDSKGQHRTIRGGHATADEAHIARQEFLLQNEKSQ